MEKILVTPAMCHPTDLLNELLHTKLFFKFLFYIKASSLFLKARYCLFT